MSAELKDRITGNARENIVAAMGEIAIAQQTLMEAYAELSSCLTLYGRGVTGTLPEAGKYIEEAAERSVACFERVQRLVK